MPRRNVFAVIVCFLFLVHVSISSEEEDDENPYTTTDPKKREPSPCEICKFFVNELKSRLDESAKSKEMIETGHSLERRKRFKYLTSELRLTEALHEPHICEKILDYNVHAERKGSLRYAKGMSETMQTLHGLVNKGVKVELGIPYELWDKPSAEVSKMHRACFTFAERYEEVIENWYYERQSEVDLLKYLCADRYLAGKDQKCLYEISNAKGDSGDLKNEKSKKELDIESNKRTKKTKNIQKDVVEEGHSGGEKKSNAGRTEEEEAVDRSGYTTTSSPNIEDLNEIPRPSHAPPTTPLPKTGRIDGEL